MHPGESFYQFGRWDYLVIGSFVSVYLLLVFTKNIPSIDAFSKFVSILNSRGGNILILSLFGLYFFRAAMRLIYHLLGLPPEVTKESAIAMTAIGFVTGTAFGGAWGALLKTMTGADSTTPGPESPASAQPTEQPAPPPLPPIPTEVKH